MVFFGVILKLIYSLSTFLMFFGDVGVIKLLAAVEKEAAVTIRTAESPEPPPQKTGEVERVRSTIRFPYGDLETAIKIANGVHRAGGTTCQWEQLAAELSLAPKGGGFRLMALTAKTFGLVTYGQGTVNLTPLGQRIVDPTQTAAAKAEAFLRVPLYKALFEMYKTSTVPPPPGLEQEMISLGVAEKSVKKARQPFSRSAQQAGFHAYGKDRLVRPSVSTTTGAQPPGQSDGDSDETNNRDRTKNGNGGSGGRHDLIEGLIKKLPPESSAWATRDRYKWLQAANLIFDLIYERRTPRTAAA